MPDSLFRIPGTTARVVASKPTTFVSNCLRILSTEVASNNPYNPKPALFTSTSIVSNRSSAFFTATAIESSSVTSSAVTRTFLFPASSPADSGDRIVATTFHPLSANNSATARPIPAEQPVIKTVCAIAKPRFCSSCLQYFISHLSHCDTAGERIKTVSKTSNTDETTEKSAGNLYRSQERPQVLANGQIVRNYFRADVIV